MANENLNDWKNKVAVVWKGDKEEDELVYEIKDYNENYEKVIDYLKYNYNDYSTIIATPKNTFGDNLEEFYKLLDRFIHLISLHQMAMDSGIQIAGGEIKKTKDKKDSGLSNKEYEEMKKIAMRLRELKEQMGE